MIWQSHEILLALLFDVVTYLLLFLVPLSKCPPVIVSGREDLKMTIHKYTRVWMESWCSMGIKVQSFKMEKSKWSAVYIDRTELYTLKCIKKIDLMCVLPQ